MTGLTNTGNAFDQSGIHDPVVEAGTDDITVVDTVFGDSVKAQGLVSFLLATPSATTHVSYPLASSEFKR